MVGAKLAAFVEAIDEHSDLDIDGVMEEGQEYKGVEYKEDTFRICNSEQKVIRGITVKAVVEQDLESVIKALETGKTEHLYGVSRIVGYFSRISNWNKSKQSELADRIKGRAKGGYYISGDHIPHHIDEALKAVPCAP